MKNAHGSIFFLFIFFFIYLKVTKMPILYLFIVQTAIQVEIMHKTDKKKT